MTRKGFISIFTPTYNRAAFLPSLAGMLLEQSCKSFEWIIVNDGSTDGTEETVRELIGRGDLPIRYFSKPNGGKHSAFKIALEAAEGEFFLCMDDDDSYSRESVETFLYEWKKVTDPRVGALRTLTLDEEGRVMGKDPGKKGWYERSTLSQRYLHGIIQENWTCYRTDALRSVDLFPDGYWLGDRHRFYAEELWQGRFARKFRCRYLPVALRCWSTKAPVSLTRAEKGEQQLLDRFLNNKLLLDEQYDWLCLRPFTLLRTAARVNLLRRRLGFPLRVLLGNTRSFLLKIVYVCTVPAVWLSGIMKFNV